MLETRHRIVAHHRFKSRALMKGYVCLSVVQATVSRLYCPFRRSHGGFGVAAVPCPIPYPLHKPADEEWISQLLLKIAIEVGLFHSSMGEIFSETVR